MKLYYEIWLYRTDNTSSFETRPTDCFPFLTLLRNLRWACGLQFGPVGRPLSTSDYLKPFQTCDIAVYERFEILESDDVSINLANLEELKNKPSFQTKFLLFIEIILGGY